MFFPLFFRFRIGIVPILFGGLLVFALFLIVNGAEASAQTAAVPAADGAATATTATAATTADNADAETVERPTFRPVAGYMTPGDPPKRLNRYEIQYKRGYRYNYRPHATWTPCPPGAPGIHHAHHHRGYFGADYSRIPSPGYGAVPSRLTPERGATAMPPLY